MLNHHHHLMLVASGFSVGLAISSVNSQVTKKERENGEIDASFADLSSSDRRNKKHTDPMEVLEILISLFECARIVNRCLTHAQLYIGYQI